MESDISYMAMIGVCKVCKEQGWPAVNVSQKQKPVGVNNITNTI
jgi:hypothetical protein